MTDEEYTDALINAKAYFRMHAAKRQEWQIEAFKGPQSIDDRHTEREEYTGRYVSQFKFYSWSRFCYALRSLRPGATVDDTTEREFMMALERTSASMKNWTVTRNFTQASQYKGPQSFSHKHDEPRLKFDLDSPVTGNSRGVDADFPFQVLKCDICHKYRRVDASTYGVFENRGFLYEEVQGQALSMLREYPSMLHDLQATLSDAHGAISLNTYHAFYVFSDTESVHTSKYTLPPEYKLRSLHLFEQVAQYMGYPLGTDFLHKITEAWNEPRKGLQDSGRPEAAPTLGDKMLEHATHLVAFPGPKSKWTAIMINRARQKGIPAVSVPTPSEE